MYSHALESFGSCGPISHVLDKMWKALADRFTNIKIIVSNSEVSGNLNHELKCQSFCSSKKRKFKAYHF